MTCRMFGNGCTGRRVEGQAKSISRASRLRSAGVRRVGSTAAVPFHVGTTCPADAARDARLWAPAPARPLARCRFACRRRRPGRTRLAAAESAQTRPLETAARRGPGFFHLVLGPSATDVLSPRCRPRSPAAYNEGSGSAANMEAEDSERALPPAHAVAVARSSSMSCC